MALLNATINKISDCKTEIESFDYSYPHSDVHVAFTLPKPVFGSECRLCQQHRTKLTKAMLLVNLGFRLYRLLQS